LDRDRLFGKGPRAEFDLPRHPWRRERFWHETQPVTAVRTVERGGIEKPIPDAAGLLHRVEWKLDSTPAHADASEDAAGIWVILADRGGIGRALAIELRKRGAQVSLVFLGASTSANADECWLGLETPDELGRVLGPLLPAADCPKAARLVVLWNLELTGREELAGGAERDAWLIAWQIASRPVTALTRLPDRAPPRTWLVTRGAHTVAGRGGDRVLQAMAWSLWGSIAFEHPELSVVRVDLDPSPSAERDVPALLAELLRSERAGDAVAHRGSGRATPQLVQATLASQPARVRDDATYLITGGLGALGLGVAEMLVAQGARHVALVGRRAAVGAASARIARLTSLGATVRTFSVDIAERDAVTRLLDQLAAELPPLRGIVHAAGILDDGLVARSSDEQFQRVVAPKVAGAMNLHALTTGWPLDFFLLFSSVAGTLCPAGQGNYAAANAGLDALARRRAAAGLPAVSIAWGPWAEGGMVDALSTTNRERLASRGLHSLTGGSGRELVTALLGCLEPHVVAMPIPDRAALARGFAHADGRSCALLSEYAGKLEPTAGRGNLVETLRAAPRSERVGILEREIARSVQTSLGLGGAIPVDKPFRQLGMDSLMAVVVRNTLAAALERRLPATILFDHPSVAALTSELARVLEAEEEREPLLSTVCTDREDLELLACLSVSELGSDLLVAAAAMEEEGALL
jgi:NAD(P)-dependent dehydrogenase (short-subunit alcohol dehydrogenase family)